ncbi:MAG: Eco57I restriction-modification methylase domain-containing protein [Ignavibacteriaceae bacterium]|nr:Eco57I restriction-modification methylase domain-containing protein [Ignavibacteriaceae bacterium]
MILNLLKPADSLNKTLRKKSITRGEFENFKQQLTTLFNRFKPGETEENQKNLIADFLKDTFYKTSNEVNTKARIDLAIFGGKSAADSVEVMIEVKRQSNKAEMITHQRPNTKALHELLLYYLDERIKNNNHSVKNLIATNITEWYIFDGLQFEKLFYENKKLLNEYNEWDQGKTGVASTEWFYSQVIKPMFDDDEIELTATYINLNDASELLEQIDEINLSYYFKIFSPEFLLKKSYTNDSNVLNKSFYNELLYLIGLEESRETGRKIIQRVKPEYRQPGSLLENTINILKVRDRISNLDNPAIYGTNEEEQIFSVALELCITWLNRILFLKLLESQLITYHGNENSRRFINRVAISDFDELNELFFEVLAVRRNDRDKTVKARFSEVPYLNSSLFEESELERKTIIIADLKDRLTLPYFSNTVLKDENGMKLSGSVSTLSYLLDFLDSYDFGSERNEIIKEQQKTIINSSVLGLIFEKINGYKDGSVYTPGFVTMFMSKNAVRRSVINLFNRKFGWNCTNLTELYNSVSRIAVKEANDVFNEFRVCDPAVGSGHMLVSVLNEIIAFKSELGILSDRNGRVLRGYEAVVENDELVLYAENELFSYNVKSNESQRVQEAIFHEKQLIIENSLFGVDINPKSVMICRLRLWIELLKNSYFTAESGYKELETLPNIDINIKTGNSLVSRFTLVDKTDPRNVQYFQKLKMAAERYKHQVLLYKSTHDKQSRKLIEKNISGLKEQFRDMVIPSDKDYLRLTQKEKELEHEPFIFGESDKEAWNEKVRTITAEIEQLRTVYESKLTTLYGNAFEWRFEFPEVLDENGNFRGFDLIIGNPPYIRQEAIRELKDYLKEHFEVYEGTADLLTYFVELGYLLLKPEAVLHFIISNKFTRTKYGAKLRDFLTGKVKINHFIDLSGFPVFDEATVDAAIISFEKKFNENNDLIYVHPVTEQQVFELENSLNEGILIKQYDMKSGGWTFHVGSQSNIKKRVESQGTRIKEFGITINYGIKTGLNEAFIIDSETVRRLLNEDRKAGEIIKPLLRGRDITKFSFNNPDIWLLNVHNGFTNFDGERIPPVNVKDFSSVSNFLSKFDEKLALRADKGVTKYNLRDCSYLADFAKPKIIYPNMTKYMPFYLDTEGFYTNQKCFILTGKNLHYLTAFFNSNLFKFCFRDNFPELLGGTRELSKVFFEQIPVKPISDNDEKPFIELVERVTNLKKADKGTDTTQIENRIDSLVYDYYEILQSEREMIDEKIREWFG